MSFDDWSTTAGSNTTVGGVSIAEGMSPSGVNNAIRGLMAEVATYRDLLGGKVVSAGTADAQTVTTGMAMSAYAQGVLMAFEAGAALTNTGAMTINVDGIGAKSVKLTTGANPPAGAVTAGGIFLLAYETNSDTLLLLNPALDADLSAFGALDATAGLIAKTGAAAYARRTITGTASQISVANGDGASANPTLSLPADVLIPTVLTVPNTGLHLLDTNASHDLIVKPGSDLAADRTLTITTGDADRTFDISAASVTISSAAATLLSQTTQALMRSTGLGLGTASTQNTGTSGANVPLLNGNNTHSGNNSFSAFFGLGTRTAATIASGSITITSSNVAVDTEAAAATDDLDTINGGSEGDIVILSSVSGAREPTVRDGVGNIRLQAARLLDDPDDKLMLILRGSVWHELSFANVS